jgi:HK97 family phage prohead protease
MDTLYREMALSAIDSDEDQRSVALSFSSDVPYTRYDYLSDRKYNEILSHEPGSVDLGRLEEIGTLLFNHNSDQPIGGIEKVWIEGGKGRALVRFDEDEDAEKIFQKVKRGSLRGVSVGYRVHEWEKRGKEDMIATKWEPLEISIVSVPADASVGVGRSFFEQEENTEGGTPMEMEVKTVVQEAPDMELTRNEGARAERERVREIMAICRKHDIDSGPHIESGATVDQVRASILEELAARPKVATANVEVDESDKFRAGALEGTAFRAGLKEGKANEFSGMSLSMLADRCLARINDNRRGNSMEWLGRAFMSTSDFPYICGEIANKSVLEGWNEAPETWREWCGVGSAPDFRTMTMIGLGAFGNLPSLVEGEEYKYTDRIEEAQTVKIGTFGQMFALTRQAIINDDLGRFTDTMRELGAAARRTIAALPYEVLTANAALADTVTLFHTATHKNTGTGGAISIDTLNEAELKMAQHKDAGSKKRLGISPKFLLAPMALKGHVRQFFATQLIGGVENQPNLYNPWFQGGGLTAIFEHALDDDDVKQWYLAADKGRTVRVYFLNGVQSPYLETRDGWNVDGTEWKVRIDAAAAAVDYRGLFRNAGQ